MTEDPYSDEKLQLLINQIAAAIFTYKAGLEDCTDRRQYLNRYFPFGLSLQSIQAHSVAIITRCAPAVSSASEFPSFFFPAAPVSGFLSLDSRPFKLFGRASCPLRADFSS